MDQKEVDNILQEAAEKAAAREAERKAEYAKRFAHWGHCVRAYRLALANYEIALRTGVLSERGWNILRFVVRGRIAPEPRAVREAAAALAEAEIAVERARLALVEITKPGWLP